MKFRPIWAFALACGTLSLPACHPHKDEHQHEQHKVVVTTPVVKNVTIVQPYVCQIRSQKHIEVKALEEGYLEQIPLKEGQSVKKGDVLFTVMPALYRSRLDAELAELNFAEVELINARNLLEKKIVSEREVLLFEAKLAKAKARAKQAEVELNFMTVTAQFDGIVDRLYFQQGSLVGKGDLLTTLSDNSVMWVYFSVPEVRYLEYMSQQGKRIENSRLELSDTRIELVLAGGTPFKQNAGNVVTVEGKFNNENGNIAFRADFPNPDRLLRHGQTGTVRLHRSVKNAVVIPQRATFETLDKLYVYVVGADHVARRREVVVEHEQDDVFVISKGLDPHDKIVLEGIQQVHDGDKVEFEFQKPEEVLSHLKNPAE